MNYVTTDLNEYIAHGALSAIAFVVIVGVIIFIGWGSEIKKAWKEHKRDKEIRKNRRR